MLKQATHCGDSLGMCAMLPIMPGACSKPGTITEGWDMVTMRPTAGSVSVLVLLFCVK